MLVIHALLLGLVSLVLALGILFQGDLSRFHWGDLPAVFTSLAVWSLVFCVSHGMRYLLPR